MRHLQIQARLAAVLILASVLSTAATCGGPVTVENSVEGKVAVHATKVTDALKAITDAVKGLEAAGTVPTSQAAGVVKVAVQINTHTETLANLLATYDSLSAQAKEGATGNATLDKIQAQLTNIGNLSAVILVPLADEGVRKQVGDLVGVLNQTLMTLSVELAKGVR